MAFHWMFHFCIAFSCVAPEMTMFIILFGVIRSDMNETQKMIFDIIKFDLMMLIELLNIKIRITELQPI